jgi:hypothetical protein
MVKTPKTNTPVHFWGWWLPENVQNPENKHDCSFSGLVVVSSSSIENKFGRTLPSLIPGYPGDV